MCPSHRCILVFVMWVVGFGSCALRTEARERITVGPNVQVSRDRRDVAHAEVILAADPKDADRLLGGSMIARDAVGKNNWHTVAYVSSDGGRSWRVSIEGESPFDPTVAFGPDGSAYFVTVADEKQRGLSLLVSHDGGKSWGNSKELRFPEYVGPDRPWITADCTGGRYNGRVYLTFIDNAWPLGGTAAGAEMRVLPLLVSLDRGETFSSSNSLNTRTAQVPHPVFPGNGAILSDGTYIGVYQVSQQAGSDAADRPWVTHVHVSMSRDGGLSFGLPAPDWRATSEVGVRHRAPAGQQGLTIPQSLISSPFNAIAADPGSNRFGNCVYVVWDDYKAEGYRVMFSRSTDKGASWSKPMVISDIPTGLHNTARGHAQLPSIAVSRDGVVGVTWYDSRDLPEKAYGGWDVRFSASADRGQTWLPSMRVSRDTSSFTREQWIDHTAWPGHTSGLVADAAGVFHALWIDNRTGLRQVWTACVQVAGQ